MAFFLNVCLAKFQLFPTPTPPLPAGRLWHLFLFQESRRVAVLGAVLPEGCFHLFKCSKCPFSDILAGLRHKDAGCQDKQAVHELL